MATKKEDCAYPISATIANRIIEGYGFSEEYLGMTKREYYAGLAMQAIITGGTKNNPSQIAKDAVWAADALIAELNKS